MALSRKQREKVRRARMKREIAALARIADDLATTFSRLGRAWYQITGCKPQGFDLGIGGVVASTMDNLRSEILDNIFIENTFLAKLVKRRAR